MLFEYGYVYPETIPSFAFIIQKMAQADISIGLGKFLQHFGLFCGTFYNKVFHFQWEQTVYYYFLGHVIL